MTNNWGSRRNRSRAPGYVFYSFISCFVNLIICFIGSNLLVTTDGQQQITPPPSAALHSAHHHPGPPSAEHWHHERVARLVRVCLFVQHDIATLHLHTTNESKDSFVCVPSSSHHHHPLSLSHTSAPP